jgi:DNA (cytosine-5)-methyltransferase 1
MMTTDHSQLTFGSLFAGIGGIDLGFERAGMSCRWQVEINPYAQKVLAKHWPNVRRHDDVRTWPQPDTEYVDIIAGGFPCQDISYAGKGAGLEGERSGLFYEVMRIVREMGPRYVVLENVAALLTRGMGDVLGSLASVGFNAEWHCIPAAAVSAPHIRDRVFILANSQSDRWKQGQSHSSGCCERDGARKKYRPWGTSANVADTDSQGFANAQRQRAATASPRRDKPIANDWWNIEPDVGRVANGVPKRVDRLRGLGNAVVPQVAEFIGRMIVEEMTWTNP